LEEENVKEENYDWIEDIFD